jgi:AraC-like DNA-binding protein
MFVHSFRIKKQLEYLESLGIASGPLYKRTGIDPEDMQDPDKTFSLDQYISVLDYAIEQSGSPHYGLRMGREPHIAGTIGMMCASCRNLKEAFVQGCKYFSVQGDFATIEYMDDDHYPSIKYTLAPAWILKSPETAKHEIEAMFSYLIGILRINSNHALEPYRVNLVSRGPEDLSEYQEAFGVEPFFEQDENTIQFRSKDLLIPMKAFNPEAFELLKLHIEGQLKRINHESMISERVRSILLSSLRYRFPDINSVASKLNMSSRTLQRQLSNEKTSFKELLQDTRSDLAKQLLKNRSFTISEISFMLGYSDLGNFSRSFKRQTGLSPQDYRRKTKSY